MDWKMQIKVTENETEFYRTAAAKIADAIRRNPDGKIGFSTGRTTKGIHKALAEIYQREPFDCSRITVFGIDEITNMSRECKASCYYILLNEVVKPLEIPLEHFILPDPFAKDFTKECADFEAKVMGEATPDFVTLGLGENGHLGFNQPGTPFGTVTWLSYMDDSLDRRLREENKIPDEVQMRGLTLGIKNLMQCKKLMMTANGFHKKEAVKKMVEGPVTEEHPASILQLHPDCEVILDSRAGERYQG